MMITSHPDMGGVIPSPLEGLVLQFSGSDDSDSGRINGIASGFVFGEQERALLTETTMPLLLLQRLGAALEVYMQRT
jgi:hypothetical protein